MIIPPLGNPNLGLLLRPVVTDAPLPIELTSEVSLMRMPDDMLDIVRNELARLNCVSYTHEGPKTPFEAVRRPTPIGQFITYDVLSSSDFRYVTLLCDPASADPMELFYRALHALRLVEAELPVGFIARYDPPRITSHTGGTFEASILSGLTTADRTVRLTNVDVEQARELVSDMLTLDTDQFAAIRHAVGLFADLDYVPNFTPLWVLGHFIVWEALLTHNPDPNDPQDSLGRQLRRSIPLLEHRLTAAGDAPLDQSWASGMRLDRIIGKLYQYRSAIAHGSPHMGIFQKDPFKAIGWPDLDEWIRLLTKRLLRSALREPQLVMDLRGHE
jgi:hypothetical protein